MDMINNVYHNIEYEGIYDHDDDDAFYTELRRQILLLTADEDEDFLETRVSNSSSTACKRGSSKSRGQLISSTLQPVESYFSWWESENTNYSVPTWLEKLWANGNGIGTGVFIPQIVKSRRRYRPGRMNNGRSRMHKQAQKCNYEIVARARR